MTPAEALASTLSRQQVTKAKRVGAIRSTLRERRERLGLRMRDVAESCGGFTNTALMTWELGRHWPNVADAVALARFFGCEITDLWPDLGRADTTTTIGG